MKNLNLQPYLDLIRFDKPIGTILLFWPTFWGLILAGHYQPDIRTVCIFACGVWVMRALGCIINDICDRNLDGQVTRTQSRPLAAGTLFLYQAILFAVLLAIIALGLLFMLKPVTQMWAIGAVLLTLCYPLMKRVMPYPQIVLAFAFNWGLLMAFVEIQGQVTLLAASLFFLGALWTFTYDTIYAISDKPDDAQLGIHSSALAFGEHDRIIVMILHTILWVSFISLGMFLLEASYYYYLLIGLAGGNAVYQIKLIWHRGLEACNRAFRQNAWYGAFITLALLFV